MKLTRLAAMTSIALASGFGMASQVQAGALGQSRLLISDFIITDGTNALTLADFNTITILDQLTNTAGLNAVFDANLAVANTFVPTVDAAQACVGACPAENSFSLSVAPPASLYAYADSILQNAPIAGTGITVGVDANTIADVAIPDNGFGNASSTIQLTSTVDFVLARAIGSLGLSFNADAFLRTWTSAGSLVGSSAGAAHDWKIILTQGTTTLIEWNPNGVVGTGVETGLNVTAEDCNLNTQASATFNDPQAAISCTGAFAATSSIGLDADTSYSLTITHSTTSQAASVVPEPTTLALLGIALGGLGFGLKRKQRS